MSLRSSKGRALFEPEDRTRVADLWRERFGISLDVFEGYSFYRRAKNVWAFSRAEIPKLSYEAIGLRIMSFKDDPWKPTTCALQIFGRYATKNTIHLNSSQTRAFLAGRTQDIDDVVEPGYVAIFSSKDVLGCGLYSRGKLICQLPKERRIGAFAEIDM